MKSTCHSLLPGNRRDFPSNSFVRQSSPCEKGGSFGNRRGRCGIDVTVQDFQLPRAREHGPVTRHPRPSARRSTAARRRSTPTPPSEVKEWVVSLEQWVDTFKCSPSGHRRRAAGARTRQPENSKRAHFMAPALQTPPKFHVRTPKEKKEERKMWREDGKKSAKFWAPHRSGLHPSGPPPFGGSTLRGPSLRGLHPSGPPPFGAPTLSGPKIQHPKIGRNRIGRNRIGRNRIGRSRNWPKSKLAEGEIGRSRKKKLAEVEIGRTRKKKSWLEGNWPKSIALGRVQGF